MPEKWSVRDFDDTALAMLHDVQGASGGTLGSLLSEAVQEWYAGLPEIETEDEAALSVEWGGRRT